MDITDILSNYESVTQFDHWLLTVQLAVVLVMFGGVGVGAVIAASAKSGKGLALGLGIVAATVGVAMAVGAGVLAWWPNGLPETKRVEAVEKLTDAAEDHYGVDLQEDDVAKAWLKMSSSEVNVVAGTHDGKKKSLGIQVDEAAKSITVYEGNVELDPAK